MAPVTPEEPFMELKPQIRRSGAVPNNALGYRVNIVCPAWNFDLLNLNMLTMFAHLKSWERIIRACIS